MCSRGHWRPAEDDKLLELVKRYGPHNWNAIAEKLQGRSGKSCRLRWFNQLDPRINRSPFTEEEEERLLASHRIHGNRWAVIARLFSGRTDNALKNHWHVITARTSRLYAKRSAQTLINEQKSRSKMDGQMIGSETLKQDKNHPMEFYDFLQVNTDSNKSQVTNNARRDDEEVDQEAREQQSPPAGFPFIDFLWVPSSSSSSSSS